MMSYRILFVSDLSLQVASGAGYNGGGWVAPMVKLSSGMSLETGYLGLYATDSFSRETAGTFTIYKAPRPVEPRLKKLRRYYFGGRADLSSLRASLDAAIADFRPDVIYLFGIESMWAEPVLAQEDVPVVVHLQGLIGPCYNACYPPGMNDRTFLTGLDWRERVLRNGFVHMRKQMQLRSSLEIRLLRQGRFYLGRTEFDRKVVDLIHPGAAYFHVGEILREPFYRHAGGAAYRSGKPLRILSTLSSTVYKGLDVVLKTASLLRTIGFSDFEWNVAGLAPGDRMTGFFERATGVDSAASGVRYLGVLDAEEMCRALLSADVYVHPSYIDNSPNSICEAQLLGVPVVATRVGGVSSLIDDGTTGFLIPANGVFELSWLLIRLSEDVSLRTHAGKSGFEAARGRNSVESVAAQFRTALESVLNHE